MEQRPTPLSGASCKELRLQKVASLIGELCCQHGGGGKMLIINVLRVFMLIFMQQIYEEFFNYANKFWRVRPFVGVRDANGV